MIPRMTRGDRRRAGSRSGFPGAPTYAGVVADTRGRSLVTRVVAWALVAVALIVAVGLVVGVVKILLRVLVVVAILAVAAFLLLRSRRD